MGLLLYPKGVRQLSTLFVSIKQEQDSSKEHIVADEVMCILKVAQANRDETNCTRSEFIALDGAEIKYSTVQNWYPETKKEKVFTFCNQKRNLKPMQKSLDTVETGSAVT
jgi:Fe-S cluster assembly protein SufB